jgi:hypothetical protein
LNLAGWKIIATGWLVSSAALAGKAGLDGGDRPSGTIVRMKAASLWLETPCAGTLKLPWAQVSRIETDAPVRVRPSGGTELDGQLRAEDDRQLRIRIGSLAEATPR